MKLNFKPIVISVIALTALLLTASITLARDYVVPDEPLNVFYNGEYHIGMTNLSTDGRFIVTVSSREDTHYVYLHDRQTNLTELASVNSSGIPLPSDVDDSYSVVASVSDDGRYIAFDRRAENGQYRTYLRDRLLNVTREIPFNGIGDQDATADYMSPRITPDGRFIVYYGRGVLTPDNRSHECVSLTGSAKPCLAVYVYNTNTGKSERISINDEGEVANYDSSLSDISDNGRYVLFFSHATNLGGPTELCDYGDDENQYPCLLLYIHDRQLKTTQHVLTQGNEQGLAVNALNGANISGNGRVIVYGTHFGEQPDDGFRVFMLDRLTGETVSIGAPNPNGEDDSAVPGGQRAISDDGRFVLMRIGQYLSVYDLFQDELAVVVDSSAQPAELYYDFLLPYAMSISGDGAVVWVSRQTYDGQNYFHLPFLAEGQSFPPAPYSEVELVKNGGAETQGVMTKMAQDWQITDYRAGRRRCDHFPHTDSCVFQIKPVTGKIARFTQSVPAVNNPGDVLKFSAFVRGFNVKKATVRVLVNYVDGTSEFIKIPAAQLNGTYDYKQVTATMMLDKLASSIKVQMYIHYRGTGKLLVDDVSLMMGSGAPTLIEIPPLPNTPTPDGSLLPGRMTH